MKALEKAAKDREGGDPAPAAAAKDGLDLELEPMLLQATPAHEAATAQPARATASAAASPRQPAEAATVMSAGLSGSERAGAGSFLREHPLAVFGGFAGLAFVGYGVYVYLQLTNPGLFVSSPAPVAQIAPPPKPVVPAAPSTPPSEPLSPLTLADVNAISRNFGENRGHGLHPSVFR